MISSRLNLLLFCLALVLASCGSTDSGEEAEAEPTPTTEPTAQPAVEESESPDEDEEAEDDSGADELAGADDGEGDGTEDEDDGTAGDGDDAETGEAVDEEIVPFGDDALCVRGAWPDYIGGQPLELNQLEIAAGGEPGTDIAPLPPFAAFFWRDAEGFSLRVLDSGLFPEIFRFEIQSTQDLATADIAVVGAPAEALVVEGRFASFEAPASLVPAGVDIPGCGAEALRIDVFRAGALLPEGQIFVGQTGTAFENPLFFERR